MDENMEKGFEKLADRPNTSAIETEMFEDVYEEMYASTVKPELLEDDQPDLCLSALKTEAPEDAPQEFYFCAVEMDGLEDDEFKKQSQYQLEQERLTRKRQRATERQRRYKARQKMYADKLEAIIASSQKECDEHSQNCAGFETQENSQTSWANSYLIEQLEKRNLKRKQAAERQKRFRESRKQKEEHLQATITTTDENSLTDITHPSAESTVKSKVSANIDYVEDSQIVASLNRAEQELDKLMEKRKKNRESQQRCRRAKKLKEITAYANSSSQSSTDESQNAIEKIGPADVDQKGSHKTLGKVYKKVPVFKKDLSSAQRVTKTGVSTTNVDRVESQTQRNLQKDEPQKFYITQIKLGNVCHLEENDVRSDKERFYIKQIKLGNVCDQSKKNVQSEEERENNAKQNLLNFLAAQASNYPNQVFAEQWEM
ncbi:calponin homology domain-containing protein DDB_G0272472-like [Nasonia vitripennis]|uniref:Uncharacterized protein n=1 Tax=Nasonia vitripennis TaxID=7425 RepID=A0A7M7LKH9_NASVI|nr:calponin homology domain-containing protein DDB_G0272472-like [Nasonia vitripennis]